MANGSFIAVTPGSGAKLATGPTYTENSNVVQDPKMIQGLQYLATYRISSVTSASLATAASHLLQIMAGSSLNVYVRHIWVWQIAVGGALTADNVGIYRLTSAGTGGTVLTPAPLDPADAASGAAAMILPSAKGSESTLISSREMLVYGALPTVGGVDDLIAQWDFGDDLSKMLKIAAGTSNGVVLKNITGVASATVNVEAEILEAAF